MVQIDVLLDTIELPDHSNWNDHAAPGDDKISSYGYSPGAIILTLVAGGVIALGALMLAARRYPPGMPLAATCSAAISAACHPPPEDVDAAVLPVQWGVVSTKDGIGHCSLSSKLVGPLVPGRTYV